MCKKIFVDLFKKKETGNDIKNKIKYLKYCHSNIQNLKSSIYQRASILMAAIAFIVTGFSYFILEVFKGELEIFKSVPCIEKIILILSILFLILFLCTAFLAIKCLFPFDYSKDITKNNNIKYKELADMDQGLSIKDLLNRKMMFTTFEYICDLNELEFEKMAKELNKEKILEQLISSTYYVADITKSRYEYLRKAYWVLFWKMIVFAIMIFICIILKFTSLFPFIMSLICS
jgi:hypothetical protein